MDIQKRQELFSNPTKEFRGKPFWSWNGKLEKNELFDQIDIMKQMGFGGYFMHSRTGLETEYLGKEWFELTNSCADYGLDADMESWLYDEDRWPSGTAGGLVTREEKYRAMFLEMKLYTTETLEHIDWNTQIVIAFACQLDGITYTKERVLKENDKLYAQETAIVFQTRYSECKDFYNGYAYVDTMSREGVNRYIALTHEIYKEKCKNRIGTSIKGIFTDEPHRGAMFSDFSEGRENAVPYTPNLFLEFNRRFGYDLKLHLLELFLWKDGMKISKVTRDYIELCQELFLENFAAPIQEWCHKNNLIFTGHVIQEDSLIAQTIMQGSLMRFYEYMDYPGIDLLTESNDCYWIVKQIASVARQLNKKWILSELYGATGWQMDFEAYKNVGVWQSLFGVNLRCPHLSWYTMKGEAKRDYPASILHQSAWYEEFQYVEDYFSRIHVALFDGKPCCQLLVLNPIESVWARAYSTAFQGLEPRDEDIMKLEKQYEEVFESLVHSRIDFDYGEEDILSRHGRVENGFLFVGQCCYSKVLVAGMEIMRSSTLALLEELKKQGGEVIFAGEAPGYVDALPSKAVIEFSQEAVCIPFQKEAIAKHCSSGNEVTVEGEAGKDIFAQVQISGEDRIIMLLNINRDTSYQNVSIGLGEGNSVELWDAKSGKITYPEQTKKNGKIYVKIDFAKGEEKLFVILEKNRVVPTQETNTLHEIVNIPDEFHYHLSEKNICVLDLVKVITKNGETIECQEVLRADRALRELIGIPYRGGEMIQPWYQVKYNTGNREQLLCKLSLEYNFEIETIPNDVMLVMEDLEHSTEIKINDRKLRMKSDGKWIDICFDRIAIPKEYLKIGTNQIVIQYDYDKTGGIEALYLLGDFGVTLAEGKKAVLTTLPPMLKLGDISKQGLPFYSGKISYIIDNLNHKKLRVKVADYEGSCVKLVGDSSNLIAWSPYFAEINNLTEIQVILTRRNTFGPLHQLPARTFACAPNNFVTTGNEWSDEYILLPQGLMKAPQIWEEE
jgi:hypothetical protein